MLRARKLLSEAETRRITRTVAAVHSRHGLRIIPVVVTSSSHYPRAEDVVGLVAAAFSLVLFYTVAYRVPDNVRWSISDAFRNFEWLPPLGAMINVQGHTDNAPIRRGPFPSNWELSFQRAVNVVRFLIVENGIYPERLATEGYGEYRPIASNSTAVERQQNRRIEIHILYAGEDDGNLKIIADAFGRTGMEGQREDGTPIKRRRGKYRRD